ncbi:hypothetical protein ACHAXR_003410 [Thalassiosira sp. AJA248-18]
MQQQQALFPTQGSDEAEDPGRAVDSTNDCYEPNTGHGATLVDAKNAFNKINRYLMLWGTYHCWNAGSRFVFKRYRQHNIFYVQSNPREPSIVIHSQEGGGSRVTFLVAFCMGLDSCLSRSKCEMRAEIPTVLQTLFADDMAGVGTAAHNAL